MVCDTSRIFSLVKLERHQPDRAADHRSFPTVVTFADVAWVYDAVWHRQECLCHCQASSGKARQAAAGAAHFGVR
jgi:hypothetical protein